MIKTIVRTALAASLFGQAWGFPNLPFVTDGPRIVDMTGASLKFAGTNWPGHGEVMIPEGLQYQSIEKIVTDIKSLGMNVIRLTFAIEMVDEIYNNDGEDIDLQTAFISGLGQDNGTAKLADVLANNPQFTEQTTRLEVSCVQTPVAPLPENARDVDLFRCMMLLSRNLPDRRSM
jgi:hypothetical protein